MVCARVFQKSKEIAMRTSSRFVPIASCAAVAAALAGCTYNRTVSLDVPTVRAAPAVVAVPANPAVVSAAAVEFGRVTAIEYFPGGTASTRINVPGAIVGARDATTVLGAGPGTITTVTNPAYRVTIQTDAGGLRTYDVPGTGDLRLGDRVRIESGVIYRS
jgi:outer membrane lipoprotein SlyB